LLRPESYAGLGPLPEVADRPRSGGAQPAADESATRAKPEAVRSAEKREAERLLAQAKSALEEAERWSAEASTELDKARQARDELEQQATYLREQLADVERRIAEVDLDRRRLGKLADRAAIHVDRARKQVDVARRRLERDS
jgi:chromosome segregation ATPase